MPACRTCSDVDFRTRDIWNAFEKSMTGFCTTSRPSVYALSKALLAFKKDMVVDPLGAEPAGLAVY
jgi:hypothetical protein